MLACSSQLDKDQELRQLLPLLFLPRPAHLGLHDLSFQNTVLLIHLGLFGIPTSLAGEQLMNVVLCVSLIFEI